MNKFSDDEFLKSLLDNIPEDSRIKKNDILRPNPSINSTLDENNNNNNNNNSNNIYDFSKMSSKEFYDLYYNAQNKQTADSFNIDSLNQDISNLRSNLPPGIEINIGIKNKCGGNEMPSLEKVKSQKLDQSDYDIMCRMFDEKFLDEGAIPFDGLKTDYPAESQGETNPGFYEDLSEEEEEEDEEEEEEDEEQQESETGEEDYREEQSSDEEGESNSDYDDSGLETCNKIVETIIKDQDKYHSCSYQAFNKLTKCGESLSSRSSPQSKNLKSKYPMNISIPQVKASVKRRGEILKTSSDSSDNRKDLNRGLRTSNSDAAQRDFVYDVTLMDMDIFSCSKKSVKCVHSNGECISRARLGDIIKLRKEFWGMDRYLDAAPTETERKLRMTKILLKSFDQKNRSFSFFCGDLRVCQAGFLILIGISTRESRPPKHWQRVMRDMQCDGFDPTSYLDKSTETAASKERSKELKRKCDKRSSKFQHATTYILYVAAIFSDTSPTKSEIKAVPYESITQLFMEYNTHCESTLVNMNLKAGKGTFTKAFKELGSQVKLVGSKGTFQTCDICNNANTLLRSGKIRFNKAQREVILKFKRLHLFQQMKEREHQLTTRQTAIDNKTGRQPNSAYILFDGMTVYSGNTPKVGGGYFRRGKKDSVYITNRVIGVEVACGPIQKVYLYHTDDFVGGGANTMIEVLRTAISDLSADLHNLGLSLPRSLALQLDNCGENKNKIMFGFLSLLIESHIFDTINVNFLIVGHTHTTIDQYFGVLTEAIKRAYFIGSPISLQHLLERAHDDASLRPAKQKQLTIIHDYKTLLLPYLNDKIKYFQFPHNFLFKRVYGKACMQYKLFSTHLKWLPTPPARVAISFEELESKKLNEIPLQQLSIVDGLDSLSKELELNNQTSLSSIIQSKSNTNNNLSLDTVVKIVENIIIEKIEKPSMVATLHRFQDDEDRNFADPGNDNFDHLVSNKHLSDMEYYLKLQTSSNKEGYMIWLETLDKKTKKELPFLLNLSPEPIYPITFVETLINLLPPDNNNDDILDEFIEQDDFNEIGELKKRRNSSAEITATISGSKVKSKLLKSAKEILKVAKHVVLQCKRGHFTVRTDGKDDVEYTAPVLSELEYHFYEKRSTLRGVLSIYYSELLKLPDYEIVILTEPTEEEKRQMEVEKERTRREVETCYKVARAILVKHKHDAAEGEAILTNKLTIQQRQPSTSSPQRLCSVIECVETGVHLCLNSNENEDICFNRYFCSELHGSKIDTECHVRHSHQTLKPRAEEATAIDNIGNILLDKYCRVKGCKLASKSRCGSCKVSVCGTIHGPSHSKHDKCELKRGSSLSVSADRTLTLSSINDNNNNSDINNNNNSENNNNNNNNNSDNNNNCNSNSEQNIEPTTITETIDNNQSSSNENNNSNNSNSNKQDIESTTIDSINNNDSLNNNNNNSCSSSITVNNRSVNNYNTNNNTNNDNNNGNDLIESNKDSEENVQFENSVNSLVLKVINNIRIEEAKPTHLRDYSQRLISLLDHNQYKTILPFVIRKFNFVIAENEREMYETMLLTNLSKSNSRQKFINYFVNNHFKINQDNNEVIETSRRSKQTK